MDRTHQQQHKIYRPPLPGSILIVCLIIAGMAVVHFQGTARAATICSAKSFGATGNGTTKDTSALQQAINACAGGGTVELTSGKYLSGPLTLPGNIIFQIDSGATLLASQTVSDYPASGSHLQALLSASKVSNVTITGSGTIDGQGASWWAVINAEKAAGQTLSPRPAMIDLETVTTATISGITIKNAPNGHITMKKASGVTITHIAISSPSDSPNTDGIDVWSSSNVTVTNSTIDDGDDDIAIDSSASDGPAHDIFLSSCTILHGHGLSIGSFTGGGVYNVNIHDNTLTGTSTGVRLKTARDRGGEVTGVTYTHLTMTNVSTPISLLEYYPKVPADGDPAQAITSTTPNFHNITISKITATGASNAGQIVGVPELPMTGITLTNVNISAKTGLQVRNATVSATSTTLTVSSGSKYILESKGVVNS
ncbi:MAG TPA: glycosyl hydrolase family 28 protein [Ktedonobacteraceae bacterium]|nr:glycosyl hydrolase family 28 protein [Ktedonobacteraceae bacterium]